MIVNFEDRLSKSTRSMKVNQKKRYIAIYKGDILGTNQLAYLTINQLRKAVQSILIDTRDLGLFETYDEWMETKINGRDYIDELLESGDLKFVAIEDMLRDANLINK